MNLSASCFLHTVHYRRGWEGVKTSIVLLKETAPLKSTDQIVLAVVPYNERRGRP
jgi:hypothetical protein